MASTIPDGRRHVGVVMLVRKAKDRVTTLAVSAKSARLIRAVEPGRDGRGRYVERTGHACRVVPLRINL